MKVDGDDCVLLWPSLSLCLPLWKIVSDFDLGINCSENLPGHWLASCIHSCHQMAVLTMPSYRTVVVQSQHRQVQGYVYYLHWCCSCSYYAVDVVHAHPMLVAVCKSNIQLRRRLALSDVCAGSVTVHNSMFAGTHVEAMLDGCMGC